MRAPSNEELVIYNSIADSYLKMEESLPKRCGLRIMLSPLVIEPRVLWIGINPAPWANMTERDMYDVRYNSGMGAFRFDDTKKSNNKNIRRLIEQCFKRKDWLALRGMKDVGNDIVFINYTPFYTKRSSDLKGLEHSEDIKMIERQMIHKLISLINPRLIICGGTKGCYYRLKSSKGIGIRHVTNEVKISENVLTAKYDNEIDVLAFARITNGFRGGKRTRQLVQDYAEQILGNK